MVKLKSSFKKSQKKNIVFLPYKASMWDSLESIWKAAFLDKAYCNTYVIPVPYADLNPNGTVAKWHCEINLFPKNVPVLDFRKVDLTKLKPDVTFFHNPYDNFNRVTSVDSFFYSTNLKSFSKILVYVPYYATNGIMSESQSYMPSYDNADYIIIQSESMRSFFDANIPDEKFLPFGSPKFDRVIHMCNNPPKVPDDWKNKINGRKVYFFNTSLGGLLRDPEKFLRKMIYVFETFKYNKNACLLWRPHPLTEATLSSMHDEALNAYNQLKDFFIEQNIGIYDESPDIDKSIAISDVYIGDSKTSVTSLFGVAGKPIFFMNNNIDSAPQADDWKSLIKKFHCEGKDWIITQGNKLYHSPNSDFHYEYYCNLSDYGSGNYYKHAFEINKKVYIFPYSGQDILIVDNHKIERKIKLKSIPNPKHKNLFNEVIRIEDKIFLVPNNYPSIVCYDLKTDELKYISGFKNFFIQNCDSDVFRMSYAFWNDELILVSPNRRAVLSINIKTFAMKIIDFNQPNSGGFIAAIQDKNFIWLLPYKGLSILRLNLINNSINEYSKFPQGFKCKNVNDKPFSSGICVDDELLLIPSQGNMFVKLDTKTGIMSEWKNQFKVTKEFKNCYYRFTRLGMFMYTHNKKDIFYFESPTRFWYRFNLQSKTFEKIDCEFNIDDLKAHSNGFVKNSQWAPYGCYEGILQPLKDLLDDKLIGNKFNREDQLKAYDKINASPEGKCGERVYKFIKDKMSGKE